jgi:subtilase family serine protease/Tol biopolymer transport system component/flagellar hook assembly protein FlgD/fibronectin type 3 domain-containing protein
MGIGRFGKLMARVAALLATAAALPFAFADGSGPIDPFPITGAYSAFQREDRDHISVIEFAGNYDKTLGNGASNVEPRAVIAREFFRTHPDHYDFLVAFSTFEFNTGDALAFHWGVQNKVQGIGIRPFDVASLFGSQGKLQGFIDMAALTRYKTDPLDPQFETALSVLAHEMLHQWGAYVKFKKSDGTLSDALLGKDGAHWSYLLDSNASVQYGADWRDNGDGSFTSVGIRKFFSPLDLYLAGFYKPQEVPPFFVIENAQIDKTKLPEENVTITGTKRVVTIDDVIAAEGARAPAAEQAQKEFRLGFILLAGPGQPVTDAQIGALNNIRNAFMTRFAIQTAGRAVAQVYPEALPTVTAGTPTTVSGGDLRTTPASIDEGLAWLRSRQRAEGSFSDKDTTTVRDTTVAVSTLSSLDAGFGGAGGALQWLSDHPAANTDYLARHARLISDLSRDSGAIRAQLLSLQNGDGGWGIAQGYQSNALDTALALLAIAGATANATALDKAALYLLSKQNADGGWSNAPGSPSRATVTTTVLQALKTVGRQGAAAPAALAWLRTKQNPDGGFGDSPSTVHDTAQALQAFMALDALGLIRADNAAGYLLSRQTTAGSWDGSVYATAAAVSALKRFSFPNWTITSMTATPASPRDGDRVTLTVTVKNDANVFAPVGVLRIYDGAPENGGTPIGTDITIPTLAPGAAVTFSPLWDTFNKAGTHTLVAVVDPNNAQTEMSKNDNRASTTVIVQPAPPGVDLTFGATGISVTPPNPNRLPTTLGISVAVRNLGLTDAHNVRVVLWLGAPGGTKVGETTLDVLNRSTVLANFSYALTRPGTVTFSAQIDPDNAIAEVNKANNSTSVDVALAPSVDLVVTGADIHVDKNPAIVGDDVTFKVKLRNEGTVDAPSTQVRYLITDGNVTRELRTNSVQLGAGQSTEQTIPWRVDLSGTLTFTVQLDPSGLVPEIDESNNVATFVLNAGAATGPNLAIGFQDFTFNPNPGREGYPLVLSALVRNTGTAAAINAEVAFYNGDPGAGGTPIGAVQVIPSLLPGAQTTVSVTLAAIPDSADKLLFVVADPANKIVEFSETDNTAFNVLPVLSLPDLAISDGDIQLTPAFPRTGDAVAVTVRVVNLGAQSVTNVLVRAYNGDPQSGGTVIGDQMLASIAGFGSGIVTFNLSVGAATTSRPIVIQVDPVGAILERTKSNNTARRDVAVQDANLFVTNKFFSPDGDGVKDTTQLFFRLPAPATVSVEVRSKRDLVVRRFAGANLTNVTGGDVVWDGLDDLGRVVQDGTYRLRVAGTGDVTIGEVTVEVDTNRSSLIEADGTKFASFSNLTCDLPDVSFLSLTNDDETAFFAVPFRTPPLATYPQGIYRMAGDGTDIRTIVPQSFFDPLNARAEGLVAGADGRRLAFSRIGTISGPPTWVVDGDGKNLRQSNQDLVGRYVLSPDSTTLYGVPAGSTDFVLESISLDTVFNRALLLVTDDNSIDRFSPLLSPDGTKLLFRTFGSDNGLWIVDTRTAVTRRLTVDNVSIEQAKWSPNSRRLAVTDPNNFRIVVFSDNGALVRTIDSPVLPVPGGALELTAIQWASSSAEFAFTSRSFSESGGEGYGYGTGGSAAQTDPGGIFIADLVTGKVEKVAAFQAISSCGECCDGCGSYHVSTWDGSRWVERGVLHYGMHYQEQTLDLSRYLPDADGQYRVRIRQQGMEAAHVETVALLAGTSRYPPSAALHLGLSKDVLADVLNRDNVVLDLHEAEMEVRWDGPIPNKNLRLALNAREEILSTRKAVPFDYPPEPDRVYEYRIAGNRPLMMDGNQTADDGLSEPLFKVFSKPDTGHPAEYVYGFVQSDAQYLYAALDFTVDNTLDGDKDWAALRVKTATGWKDFKVIVSDGRYGKAGFVRTGTVYHPHKYYEFKVPLAEIGAREGDVVAIGFQAYGTAAIIPDANQGQLFSGGQLFWVPGERTLLYHREFSGTQPVAILLDDNNRQKPVFADWFAIDFRGLHFSPTGRQLLFESNKQALDPTSTCYLQGFSDTWNFKSLLNLTADLRAIRSAKAGGIQLKGTASDLNFSSYVLEYATVAAPNNWLPIAPASGQPVVDDLFTTWVPPAPGNYFVRLSVEDLAGNVRRTVKRVSWAETPSITDVYRTPAIISPNGDGVNDVAIIHYRVLEPVHLTFEFFDSAGKRVRVITRDHSTIGIEVNLPWDGRDDNGLPVPDGRYRMTVQNYEFFITVDNTPPLGLISIREAYQKAIDPKSSVPGVLVDPGIEWKVDDVNLDKFVIERGEGADPTAWSEQRLLFGCVEPIPPQLGEILRSPHAFPDRKCSRIPLEEFTNGRFRVNANDLAGNKTVVATPLPAEQLIVTQFGNHVLAAKCDSITIGGPNTCVPGYKRIEGLPYVPLAAEDGLVDGVELVKLVDSAPVRFTVAETIRQSVAQLTVQFRRPVQASWTDAPITGIFAPTIAQFFDPLTEPLLEITTLPDHASRVTWDMAGVQAGETYVVRLHAIDASGAHHYSNTFRFKTDGLIFRGLVASTLDAAKVAPLLRDDPPKEGERILWGEEFIGEPLQSVRLFIRSTDDPRFATAREVGSVAFPQTVFIYRTKDLESCKHYFGYLEARTEAHPDPVTGALVARTIRTGERPISLPCLDMRVKVAPVAATGCDLPSAQQVTVKFAPSSLDGAELKLLTLSRTLPNNGGEDVLFNVNKPQSVAIPAPPNEPPFIYEFLLDTSRLIEGSYPFTAKLINVNDQQTTVPVTVLVDHTPALARLTYPLEGQRICGIPRQLPDGTVRNEVTFEGEISDAGGFHYQMEYAVGGAPDPEAFVQFHDSRINDSLRDPPNNNPGLADFGLHGKFGPIGRLFDKNGELTVRLRVPDYGGFQRCETRTFVFDGVVEGVRASIDRRLFSPNGDGQFDDVTVTYEVGESAVLDVDIHHAVQDSQNGALRIIGDSIRRLINQSTVLSGSATFSWDGRDVGGATVADGFYAIVLTFKDACGNVKKVELFTEVDNTPPAVTIAFPHTTDPLSLIVEIQGSVNDPHPVGYGVDFGVGSLPDQWVRLANRTGNALTVQVLAPWNTFGLEGAHAIRVVAVDAVGNQRIVQVPVNLAARTNLIDYLEAAPDLFSPNGDGKRESTALRFGLEENSLVTLSILDKSNTVRRTLLNNQNFGKGPVAITWDGKDNTGVLLPDDTYTAGLLVALASNPLLKQEEKVSVALDRTAPVIDITRPAKGFVPATGGVVGTIQDAHMAEYTVSITNTPASPSWEVLDTNTSSRVNGVFGSLQGRAEGEYALKIEAKDQGEIAVSKVIPFIIDNTPPKANLTAPEKSSFVGKKKSPVNVAGTLEEKYLNVYRLNFGSGAAPTAFTELASGNTLPLPAVIRAWDVSTLADGTYTLQLYAEDKAGLTGESRVTLTVDNTPPTAAITLPADMAYVTKAMDIRGGANDANFAEYKLELTPGAKGTSSRFSEIGGGTQPVVDGVLLSWQALPPDGVYTLRLSAKDKADNVSEALVQVTVDTKPPAAPINLRATAENRSNARLVWSANTEPDLAGYAVYRNGARITPTLLADPTYLDANLLEGRYTYVVTAFDKAGQESTKSNEALLVVDVTPPTTRISAPGNGTTVSGLFDVKGTAYSVDDFKEYRLFVGAGAAPTDFQLLRRSPVPVLADIFTQWNTVVLPEGAQFTLKLEAEDINGNIGTDRVTVTIDNRPPAAPIGLTATPSGANVQLVWNANTEPDLYGYLVFRNDRLANQQGVLVGSVKPYAIVTTNYLDAALADGRYTYYIIAMDRAGNTSDPSATATVALDNRAPHATIAPPAPNTVFDKPLYVLATSPDTDIARVQFQYRAAGSNAWINLGSPDTAAPYEATFDPVALGLSFGDYQLQAVATDQANKTDPAPTPVTVRYKDITPPARTLGVTNHVNGGDVTLTWTANTESDLAGYHIDRTSSLGSTVRLTSTPVKAATFIDANAADDTYRYAVVAVDASGNEAGPSAATTALVYTPEVKQPYTPTRDATTAIVGKGRGIATLSGEVVNGAGTVALAPAATNAQGEFTVPVVPIVSGANVITLRLTDPSGNVSKLASVTVTVGAAPSKPTGLAAVVNNLNVTLSWNANPEPDVIGYRVLRNGEALLPDEPMTDLSATATNEAAGPAAAAVDFDFSTFWGPVTDVDQPLAGQSITATWPELRVVPQVIANWFDQDHRAVDFDVEAWTGSAWVTVAQVRGNAADQTLVTFAQPYRTTQLRLVLLKGNLPDSDRLPVILTELTVMQRPLVTLTQFTDFSTNGVFKYAVTAVNGYAFESAPSDPVTQPVGDVVPPAPVTLSAAVNASDVTLTWTASASADVTQYIIVRDGANIATHTDLTNLRFVDAGRPNGTYTYLVFAVDNANNASVQSNEAIATVAVAPPAAPFGLGVSVVPSGRALDLAWTWIDSTSHGVSVTFRVLRATTAGGPYQPVGETGGFALRDVGLVDGTRYFYVVVALDALGNPSVSSNEANGVPLDTVAPTIELHYPTRPGRLFTTSDAVANIVGRTEPAAQVTLLLNGASAAEAQALAAADIKRAALADIDQESIQLSPDGRFGVYQIDDQLRLHDFTNGTDTTIVHLPTFDSATPTWSPDGREVVFEPFDTNAGRFFVRTYRLADGATRDLTDPRVSGAFFATMSPDGKQLAVFGFNFDAGIDTSIARVDLATGQWTLLRDTSVFDVDLRTFRWSPDSTRLAYRLGQGSNSIIEVVHVPSTTVQLVDGNAGFNAPGWSPDGSALLFPSLRSGSSQIWRYQLVDGSAVALTQAPNEYFDPVYAPDGKAIAYLRLDATTQTESFEIRDLTDGSIVSFVPTRFVDSVTVQWAPSGYLAFWLDGNWQRVAPAGRVEFRGVALAPGDNIFSAQAVDAASNRGVTPAPIVINRSVVAQPDLAVTDADLVVIPAAPLLGESVRVTLTVRNIGAAASPHASLSLIAVDPQGGSTTLRDGLQLNALAPGAAQTLSADWTPAGGAGAYSVVAIVDPLNELAEASEANNLALRSLAITAAAGQQLAAATDKSTYVSGDTVAATVTIRNNGDTFAGRLVAAIEDRAGFLVQNILTKDVAGLPYAQAQTENAAWPTGATFAGAYQVHARLFDSSNRLAAEAIALFDLGAASQFSAQTTTDRAFYTANDNVHATGTYTYTSGNTVVSGAQAVLSVTNGTAVLAQSQQLLGDLTPGASGTLTLDWNTGAQPVGQYRAALTVTKDGTTLATADALFRIEAGSAQLAGTLALSEAAPVPGTAQTATFSVQNKGNADVVQLPIVVSLLDADVPTPLAVRRFPQDIAAGSSASGTATFDTTGLALKNYTVALQAEIANASGGTTLVTLQTLGFPLLDRAPPQIEIRSPADNGFIRGDATAKVFALDQLSSVKRVELSVDGGPYVVVPVNSAADNLYGDLLRGLPEGTHTIRARATDAAGNVATTPVFSFIVDNTPPQIAISGVQDTVAYNVNVTPIIQVTDAHLSSQSATLNGQSFVTGTTIAAEGDYTLVVNAADAAGNQVAAVVRFTIDKTPPIVTILQPADGAILTATATGAILNMPTTPVSGRTEPLAVVSLTVGTYQASTTADAQGAFSFADVPLAPNDNFIAAFARDRAGNVGPAARVTVHVSTSTTAQLTGALAGRSGVLVWAPGTADSSGCIVQGFDGTRSDRSTPPPASDRYASLLAMIEAVLIRDGDDYLIVRNECNFLKALRSRRYATVVLVELNDGHDAVTNVALPGGEGTDLGAPDPLSGGDFNLHMSPATAREIRAMVTTGSGMVWIKTHPDANEHMDELLGVQFLGATPSLSQVALTDSPASHAGVWGASGFGLNLSVTTGVAVGALTPGGSPAMVLRRRLGGGRTALLTFDPSALADPQAGLDAVTNAIRYAAPVDQLLAGAVAEIRWTASQLTPPLSTVLHVQLPEGMAFVDVGQGVIVSARDAVWIRDVTANQTVFSAFVRLPALNGDYVVTAALSESRNGALTALAQNNLTVALDSDRDSQGATTLDLLNHLPVGAGYWTNLQQAIVDVQTAIVRPVQTREDVAYSIGKLVETTDLVAHLVGTTADAIAATGKLLGMYQTLLASLPDAPMADAGTDQTVNGGVGVTLSGTTLGCDAIVSSIWTQIAGPAVTLFPFGLDGGVNAPEVVTDARVFTAPQVSADTVLAFRLTATNVQGETGSAIVYVTVNAVSAADQP